MLSALFQPAERPAWLSFYERFLPAEAPSDDSAAEGTEVLDELVPVEALPKNPFAFLLFIVRNHFKWRVAGLYVTIFAAMLFESLTPYALNQLVDGLGVPGTETAFDLPTVIWWACVLGLLWLSLEVALRLYDLQDIYMGPKLRVLTQKYLFRYLLGHSPRYFHSTFAGRLSQKIRTAAQSAGALSFLLIRELTQLVTLLTVSFILLLTASVLYAAILLVWTLLYLGLATVLARSCRLLSRDLAERWSQASGRVVDSIGNNDSVRAFAKADYELRYVSLYLHRELTANMRLRWYLALMRSLQGGALWVLSIGLMSLAVWQVLEQAITLGEFTMIFVLVTLIGRTLRQLSFQILDFFEVTGSLSEALDVITGPHEIVDRPGAKPVQVREGGIRFENIHFRHDRREDPDAQKGESDHDADDMDGPGEDDYLFRGLDLTIRPGEKVGLVGRSGAGKSTLINLLRRQFEPQKGRTLIDGQDIAHVTWDSLNEAVAEVPQSPGIFHRSIRDNIRYAMPRADDAAVEEAARLAHASTFIERREKGYGTLVGEQGIKLSGGERQRVAIARAFLKDARILVLDEATSALDTESEFHIQQALFNLMDGRTVIAIAHRLSTIQGMDRIIVLDEGAIIEEGNHQTLLAKGGLYAQLWERQAGAFVRL